MGDDRPSVYWDANVKSWVIRASALGGCLRSLIAAGREIEASPTPKWMLEKFEEGHRNEPLIADWYVKRLNADARRVGPKSFRALTLEDEKEIAPPGPARIVWDGQWAFDYQVTDRISIRGHLDDLICNPVGPGAAAHKLRIAEYKALAPSTFQAHVGGRMMPQYPWQISAYMVATGLPLEITAMEKDDQGVVDLTKFHRTAYEAGHPPITRAKIDARAREVVRWIEEMPYGEYPACDVDMYPCPYFVLHDEKKQPALIEGVLGHALAHEIAVYRSLGDKVKDLETARAIASKRIKELLDEAGQDSGMVQTTFAGEVKVTWVEQHVAAGTREVKAHTRSYPKITPIKKSEED